MIELLYKWAVFSGVLLAAGFAMPQVRIKSLGSAIAGAATFGVANVLFGWALKFIANVILFLPKLLTLGLLGFVVPVLVNMVLLKLAANATDGEIEIQGISGLAGLSVIVTLTSVVAF